MPMTISRDQDRPFASTQRVHTTHPHYTVEAFNEHGGTEGTFVDLDSALSKMRELAVLGFSHMTITCVSLVEGKPYQ